MTKLLHITLLLLILLLFTSGNRRFIVTFYNETDYDIDSLYIDHFYVGALKKDQSLSIDSCLFLATQDGRPLVYGKIHGTRLRHSTRCGNTDSYLTEGHCGFILYLFQRNFGDYTETGMEARRCK